jgi:replicative DNA helicase
MPRGTYTLQDYAFDKQFDAELLREWGVETGTDERGKMVVVIPYRDQDGRLLRNRFRAARDAMYWEGRKLSTHLYGLDRLAKADPQRPVLLVEGESDCHAAWHHDVVAVGVPGANMWRSEWTEFFEGRDVYVWQEPDPGGETFVRKIGPDLPHAKLVIADEVKDLADLHKAKGNDFRQALQDLLDQAVPIGAGAPIVRLDAALGATVERVIERARRPVDAVPTPLESWNRVCRDAGGGSGLARGWHIVLAGSTGHGKSLAALNLTDTAIRHGERVAYITLEMSQEQLISRLMAIQSGIPVRRLEPGDDFVLADAQSAKMRMHELYERTGGCVYVNCAPIYKLDDIEAAMRYARAVRDCRYMIVDYLQLAWHGAASTMFENIHAVSHRIRQLAAELEVVSVGLSQLNRETSKGQETPKPHGLFGGSPLENDADQVAILNHAKSERGAHEQRTELIIAKNRHGPHARIPVRFDYRNLRLQEEALEGENDWRAA